MSSIKKAMLCLALIAIVASAALPAMAAIGDTGTPYSGSGKPIWKGTTEFGDSTLGGTVDWAVYGVGDFPFSGYTPTPGEFTYVYQVNNTGSAAISSFSVLLQYDADNIGWFGFGGGKVPSDSYAYDPPSGSAVWDFSDTAAIISGESSCGLVFSSPNKPMDYWGNIVDHGGVAIAEPVPSPSSTPIPEPTTLCLLGGALGMMLVSRRFGQR